MAQQPTRLVFESDGESLSPPTDDTSPVYSSTALARFEFEFGRGNEGTKILMVEWEDDAENSTGVWEVSWEGKSTVLKDSTESEADPEAKEKDDKKPLHRLYFMLGPGEKIPHMVKIAQQKDRSKNEDEGTVLYANSLPALFPKELGISGREEGKKGVLHTIWAKQRLRVLQEEIEREAMNTEGIGLDMVIREREWIIENFGVGGSHLAEGASPKTPSGGKLSEKLKGLKLETSRKDLNARPTGNIPAHIEKESAHPLSPDMGDVAFSSFALFHGTGASRPAKTLVPHHQSLSHQIAASRNSSRMSSLDAITSGDASAAADEDEELEDGLFAVKISPRSPEMTKSPFSFTDPNGQTLTWGK